MDAERLRTIPLFEGLSAKQLGRLATWTDEVDVGPGTRLIDQGTFPYEFFVIAEGAAEVTVDGARVADLGPGDFFGEMALLEHQRRTASVTATTPMRAIVMHARDFGAMELSMPEVAERIRGEMARRLGDR